MTQTTDTESAVAEILAILLNIPVTRDADIRMSECPQWDSLKHIEIIMTVEQRLGVSFAPEDIPLLVTQKSITDRVNSLL